MIPDYTPAYRGTRKDLVAKQADARKWFKAQVRIALLSDPDLSDEVRKRAETHELRMRDEVDRTRAGGYIWSHRSEERDDYFYIWHVEDGIESWNRKRFVLRKNGTINIDAAADLMKGQIWADMRREREQDVLVQNKRVWAEHFNVSVKEYKDQTDIDVKLSTTQPDMCRVKVNEHVHRFAMNATIRIDELRSFQTWVGVTSASVKKWKGE